ADVLVLVALGEHQEEPLPDGHRLAAAGTVEEARLERPVSFGLPPAARRTTDHGRGIIARRRRRQSVAPPRVRPVSRADVPTVYVETYSCQMNVADTELMLGHLAAHGWERTAAPDAADAI